MTDKNSDESKDSSRIKKIILKKGATRMDWTHWRSSFEPEARGAGCWTFFTTDRAKTTPFLTDEEYENGRLEQPRSLPRPPPPPSPGTTPPPVSSTVVAADQYKPTSEQLRLYRRNSDAMRGLIFLHPGRIAPPTPQQEVDGV
jgi:hypothetical protein